MVTEKSLRSSNSSTVLLIARSMRDFRQARSLDDVAILRNTLLIPMAFPFRGLPPLRSNRWRTFELTNAANPIFLRSLRLARLRGIHRRRRAVLDELSRV